MAILQPDILPAMAEAIHRQLRSAQAGRLSQEALAELVIPTGLSRGPAGEKMFGDTLRELRSIGAVVEDGTQVGLPGDMEGARDAGGMARIVRVRAMLNESTADLWEKDDAGSLILTGARDLVRALAWFLGLDVLVGPFDFDETTPAISEMQQQHTGERPILNKERWRPFVRWVRYLGFLQDMSLYSGSGSSQDVVVPDPTQAIAAHLPDCVDGDDWTPMTSVVARLSERLPVLDGGIYRRAVHDKGAPRGDSDCSSSLTLAFQRLARAEIVELEVGAGDAPKVTFANNQGAFHAVRWRGGAHA